MYLLTFKYLIRSSSIIANFKLLRIWHVGTSNSFEPKSVHRFKPHQKRRTSNLPTHHDLISNLGILVGVWKSSKFSFGEGIWLWRCLMFNLQNSKRFEIPYIWVRPNTIKLGSSNFIQYNIYYYYLFYIHIILRSTTLALSGKNRLKFRSKKCSCDELTRKITLIVFDYTHDELEPKPYKFKTSSKQKKALYYVSKYLL